MLTINHMDNSLSSSPHIFIGVVPFNNQSVAFWILVLKNGIVPGVWSRTYVPRPKPRLSECIIMQVLWSHSKVPAIVTKHWISRARVFQPLMEIEPLVTEPVLNDTNYVPGYFRRYGCMGSSHGDCDRSLGPGGFCSLGSTTSTQGPRISLPIASSSSSSMPEYDSSVLSLYFRIPSTSCSSGKVTGIIGRFSCKHFSGSWWPLSVTWLSAVSGPLHGNDAWPTSSPSSVLIALFWGLKNWDIPPHGYKFTKENCYNVCRWM